jgi:hypothetical protein
LRRTVLLSICVSLTLGSAFAQQPNQTLPAGTIDGRVHPELISDEIAWQTFIKFNSHLAEKSTELYNFHQKMWQQLGMSDGDIAVLHAKLNEFRAGFVPVVEKLKSGSLSVAERNDQIALRATLFTNIRGAIESSLSPNGLAGLRGYVQSIKKDIKLYPFTTTPPQQEALR